MPEGDTIHRAALTLHRALAGRRVVRFESVFPALTRVNEDSPLTGQTVEAVAARGKHLLMRFSGGQTLRTHMRMNGSWHIYRQRVVAGIGNVYKSEVLFASGVNPFVRAGELTADQLGCLIDTALTFLRSNVTGRLAPMTTYSGYRRTTRRDDPRERLWVYGRARLPCRRCQTPVRVRKQGSDARLTYWCPRCQPADGGSGAVT